MDNSSREELLLEVIKDFTSITYPEYADEDNIKEKIYSYIYHLKKFKENPDEFTHNELTKLSKLHQFFYGVSFDPENPNSTIYKTPIFDKFNLTYKKIEKLINETNDINADLLKSLLNIISVYYDPSKNKDAIINEYLDKVIIPVVNKYKGIGVVADSSLKEEKIVEIKSSIKSNIGNAIIEKKIEETKTKEKEGIDRIRETEETKRVNIKETQHTNRTKIEETEQTNRKKLEEETKRLNLKDKIDTSSPQKIPDKQQKPQDTSSPQKIPDKSSPQKIPDKSSILLRKLRDENTIPPINPIIPPINPIIPPINPIIPSTQDNKLDDYKKLKDYLQSLYLQLNIDKTKIDIIKSIISKCNSLNLITIDDTTIQDKDFLDKIFSCFYISEFI